MIILCHCTVEFPDWGAVTRFPDGTSVDATPHDTHHYHVIAHRLGYGGDTLAYCQEHEFAHAYMCQELLGSRSMVLWSLAHGHTPPKGEGLLEEMAAQQFQRWLRANERPILSGCDWDRLRDRARHLLAPTV